MFDHVQKTGICLQLFAYKLPQSLTKIFLSHNILWQVVAAAITYVLVATGFDWFYFERTRGFILFALSAPAIILGFVVPIFLPLILLAVGLLRKNTKVLNAGYALAQSAAIAYGISIFYKAITGRVHPYLYSTDQGVLSNISQGFHFGFYQGGIVWGWPSGHTIVAFALATTAVTVYPNIRMKVVAFVSALYIALAMSVSLHWFSDVIAGAIMGSVVGMVVGRAFKTRLLSLNAA